VREEREGGLIQGQLAQQRHDLTADIHYPGRGQNKFGDQGILNCDNYTIKHKYIIKYSTASVQ